MKRILNFIDGEFIRPIHGAFMPNYDPALGEVYGEIPDSDEEDIEKAIEAADKAFPRWSATSIQERSRILLNIANAGAIFQVNKYRGKFQGEIQATVPNGFLNV